MKLRNFHPKKSKRSIRCSWILIRRKQQIDRGSADRFIGLPDDVIRHILSFLPTKASVQTSTLSKSWRSHWAHVPFLEFNSDDYRTPTHTSKMIVNQLMSQHKQGIHTFRFDYRDDDSNDEEFGSWIADITSRNIRNLVISLGDQLKLPQCLFTCDTLVYLSLSDCGDIPEGGPVYFPCLKKLELNGVDYESRESLPHLLSGCPVLEELSIEGDMCFVTSPTLTRLVIDPKYDVWTYEDEVEAVKLDTPALRYLLLHVYVNENFSAGALESLIEADLDLYWDEPIRDNFSYSRDVLTFVAKLYNVKCLKLSTRRMAVPDSDFSALAIKFHNLTELDLFGDLRFLTSFLENANNLRVLKLKIQNMVDIDNEYCWPEPKQVPTCLKSHLATVNVIDFGCSKEHEFDVVRYILVNAKVLKRLEIYTRPHGLGWKKKYDALKRLALFERGSQTCQLGFN